MMNQPTSLHFLAISGSLRAASSNTVVLRAAAALAPEHVQITLYDGLGDLPHFNPDRDGDSAPPSVTEFRRQLQEADGVLICSPEYAHGVPGTLKNALDWIVGSGEFIGKPVALLDTKPQAKHAQASLSETLSVMMAHIIPEASLAVPLGSNVVDEAAILANPALCSALTESIAALIRAARSPRAADWEP